ncbi:MAG: hypothetical protein B7Y53_03625 [Halothiobacillus sp. 28-55-5]|nr:MAG: hypothetical protein B7Y53_03625 [Halothiobacillus sp. 28-55-5]
MQKPASQICATHIELITAVADSRRAGEILPAAQTQIEQYQHNGWVQLAHTLTAWMNGAEPDLARLDAEDQHIILGIDYATTQPDWLETLGDEAQTEAAESLAQMIFAATWGDFDALELLSSMREAAEDAGVNQSAAHAFVAMVEGARDIDQLHNKFPMAEQSLLNAVLNQLIEKEHA